MNTSDPCSRVSIFNWKTKGKQGRYDASVDPTFRFGYSLREDEVSVRMPDDTTPQEYLTLAPAFNLPFCEDGTSGGTHFFGVFQGQCGRQPGPFPIAGRDGVVSTYEALGDEGVRDRADIMRRCGAYNVPDVVYCASHARAYVDSVINSNIKPSKWLSMSSHRDWMTDEEAGRLVVPMLERATRHYIPHLADQIMCQLERNMTRVERWWTMKCPKPSDDPKMKIPGLCLSPNFIATKQRKR